MVHMGLVGQYFSELDPNYDGPPRAADPAVQARKLVGMERRDVILTAVFGTLGALVVLLALGLAFWLYLRARRSKQRDAELEDRQNGSESTQPPVTKRNGFLNLRTPLISTKALGNGTKINKTQTNKVQEKVQEVQTDTTKVTNKKKQKTYTKKRFTYSQEALEEAIAVVNSKTCSITNTAKQYGIPVGTLFKKVNEKFPLERRMGPSTVLTAEEESKIKQWILDKAEIGYPMHHMIVREAVKSVLDNINRPNPFKNNLPGVKWLKLFLGRHPEIKNKRTEMLSRVRAAVTEPKIRAWFEDVKKYLTDANAVDALNDPSRIYNMDETGVSLCPKTGKLLAPVKEKNVYCISPGQDRQQITVLCCFSASGVSVRPMIMYPYKRSLPKEIITSVPDGYAIGLSETGWMTTPAFYEYIVNCFYPQLLRNSVKFPVILFFDGHSSHISIELHVLKNKLFCTVSLLMHHT